MSETARCAPVKGCAVALFLAAILALAAAVCAAHWVNAVTLRGTADAADYAPAPEGTLALVEDVSERGGVLYLSGALPREDIGAVRLRVALLPPGESEMTLLNTQMVRRYDLAAAYGCDDHCGFAAAALGRLLAPGVYAVTLADESDGAKRLADTGVRVTLGEGGHLQNVARGEEGL